MGAKLEEQMLDTHLHGHFGSLEQLRCIFDSSACNLDYKVTGRETDRLVQLEHVPLKGVDVFRYESNGLRGARRSYQHIRTDHVDDFLISVPLTTPVHLSHDGREARVEPGSFVFMSTAKPFEAFGETSSGAPVVEYIVRLSGALLRNRVHHIDRCCNQPVRIRSGAGKIMCSLFELALHEGASLSQRQSEQFSATLFDSIASTTLEASELNACFIQSRPDAPERVRRQACAYISEHLSRPDLRVKEIAEHCHVSVRYLHAAFEPSSRTVAEVIREMRLQSSRNALRDPTLSDETITEVVMKWGFNHSASFSRLYKSRFGVTPREDRRTAQSSQGA